MREMKYVVTQRETELVDVYIREIFIFEKAINHDCFAEMITRIKDQTHGNWVRVKREVVSAGFTDGVTCYGESESLGLKSSKHDTALLLSLR